MQFLSIRFQNRAVCLVWILFHTGHFKEPEAVLNSLVGCQRLNAEEGMGKLDNRTSVQAVTFGGNMFVCHIVK